MVCMNNAFLLWSLHLCFVNNVMWHHDWNTIIIWKLILVGADFYNDDSMTTTSMMSIAPFLQSQAITHFPFHRRNWTPLSLQATVLLRIRFVWALSHEYFFVRGHTNYKSSWCSQIQPVCTASLIKWTYYNIAAQSNSSHALLYHQHTSDIGLCKDEI